MERILTKCDNWQGEDCERSNCLLCKTQKSNDKKQSCKKRNVVYKISCLECLKSGQKSYYYGESCRSCYERGREQCESDSHMLKHVLLFHKEVMDEVEFGMEIVKAHKSAFERQIHEAVTILLHRKGNLMNSKSEYTRSSVPRLLVKQGNS